MRGFFYAVILGHGLLSFVENSGAQNEEKPQPKAPYLAEVPDYGHWIVTIKYETPAPTDATAQPTPLPEGIPTAIDTIKTGDLRGVTLTFSSGTTRQYTCQGDCVLTSTPQGPKFSVASPSQVPYVYYTPAFILLDGVKVDASTYLGVAKLNGTPAFHYRSGEIEVWTDLESMRPLAVKTPGLEAGYQFLAPPPRPFVIPPEQEALLKKQREADRKTHDMR